jgi:tetratricopeptide (TPR) repeat protein
MEKLFQQRLPEFYETLAFHFKQGRSLHRAVDYLMKAAEKSLNRYALEESHQYYKEAFDLLTDKPEKTQEEERLLIDLILKWAIVFYYRGDLRGISDLIMAHETLAKSLGSREKLGMLTGWLGFAQWMIGDLRRSYRYLSDALKLGEEGGDQRVIGYACCWLSWACADLGLLDEAIRWGERALEISKSVKSDHYLYSKSLGGISYTCFLSGDRNRIQEAGKDLLQYGKKHSNVRSSALGHWSLGSGDMASGDYPAAIVSFEKAVQVAQDPIYRELFRFFLGVTYLYKGQIPEAEEAIQKVSDFSQQMGWEGQDSNLKAWLGLVAVAKGDLSRGLKALEEGSSRSKEEGRLYQYARSELILGNVYSRIVQVDEAERHFLKAIEAAKEIGSRGVLGLTYLGLGMLYGSQKKGKEAKERITEAIALFQECNAEVHLRNARQALESLG